MNSKENNNKPAMLAFYVPQLLNLGAHDLLDFLVKEASREHSQDQIIALNTDELLASPNKTFKESVAIIVNNSLDILKKAMQNIQGQDSIVTFNKTLDLNEFFQQAVFGQSATFPHVLSSKASGDDYHPDALAQWVRPAEAPWSRQRPSRQSYRR